MSEFLEISIVVFLLAIATYDTLKNKKRSD